MSILTKEGIQKILNDDWLLMDDCEGLENCTVIKELARMALAAMDSEPVGYFGRFDPDDEDIIDQCSKNVKGSFPLYRHAQPVPEMKPVGYLFVSEQGAIAYSPANWGVPGFRLIGQIYGDIDVESQPALVVPGKWIPVSERLPENKPGSYEYLVFETLNNRVNHDYWNVPDKGDDAFTPFWNYYGGHVTHWMPLPAAPQEVKGD
ncbi:DUF551 domain-containing protein [Klebsiella quasipneumoniae]|uniref:DUF551 domain-containing protein n=1 Tax=Klebsiella quasipneumoniae TaxID=1463165 RepID=UPI003556520F